MRHFLILLSSLYAVSCQTPPAAMPRRTNERVAQVRRTPSVAHRAKVNTTTGDEQPGELPYSDANDNFVVLT